MSSACSVTALGTVLVLAAACVEAGEGAAGDGALVVRSRAELGKVWAGHPVGFAFAIHGGAQYVGFYDHEHDGVTYVLRWAALGPNRDRPRPKNQTPPPSRLLLYELAPATE